MDFVVCSCTSRTRAPRSAGAGRQPLRSKLPFCDIDNLCRCPVQADLFHVYHQVVMAMICNVVMEVSLGELAPIAVRPFHDPPGLFGVETLRRHHAFDAERNRRHQADFQAVVMLQDARRRRVRRSRLCRAWPRARMKFARQ